MIQDKKRKRIFSEKKPKKTAVKLLCFFVTFMVSLSLTLTASAATPPSAVLVFASDYQYDSSVSPAQPSATLTGILDQIYSSGNTVNQTVFCGDYTNTGTTDYGTAATAAISEINNIVDSSLGTEVETAFLQGGSDTWNASLMAANGAHVYDDYILYVINTQYRNPVNQGSTNSVSKTYMSNTASALNTYLQSLISSEDPRPVFIATYMPLHMSSATSSLYTTGDNMFSSYLFNVINNAAADLDIVYLYGHNHIHGFDSYLGGSCDYLPLGSTIYIPDYNVSTTTYTNKCTEQTLNFTYMNAGYLGYVAGSTADSTLTASVFEIYDDHIAISRYAADGLHPLGAAGSYNTTSDNGAYNDSDGFLYSGTYYKYLPTASATASPQSVDRINDRSRPVSMTLNGTAATAKVGDAANLTAAVTNAAPTAYTWTTTDAAVAKVTGTSASAAVEYNKTGTATVTCTATYNDGSGNQIVSQNYTVTVSADNTYHTVYTYNRVTSITSGNKYAIVYVNGSTGYALTYNSSGSTTTRTTGSVSGSEWTPPTSLADNTTVLWTLTSSGAKYTALCNYGSNKYLNIGSDLSVGNSANLTFNPITSKLSNNDSSYYLRYSGNSFRTTSNSGQSSTTMTLYQYTSNQVQGDPTLSIVNSDGTAPSGTFDAGTSTQLYAKITNISQITGYSWSSSNTNVMTVSNATSASPTINFVGHGSATVNLTVTYNDGSTKTVSAATAALSVQSPKTYQRITSLSDIVPGQNYLIIWPLGDSGNSSFHIVSRTTMSSTNSGSTASGLTPVAISKDIGDTFTADYTDYEWQFTQSGSNWKVGEPGSTSRYMTLGSNSLTLGSTGSNCAITVSSTAGGYTAGPYFQITSTTGYSLDRFGWNPLIFSGYQNGTNRYCYLYKIVTDTPPTPVDATADIARNNTVISGTTQNRYSVSSGQTETLTPQYAHLTDAKVTWSSSNTAAAVINASGVITYKGHSGTVTFTMTVKGTNEYGVTQTLTKDVTYIVATNAKITTIRILKNDSSDNPLADAGFNLYSDSNCTTQANVYLDSACTVPLSSAPTTSLRTDAQGLLGYYGLSPGTYYLKEIYAPTGYNLLDGIITITIADDQTVTIENDNGTYSPTVADGVIKLTLTDQLTVLDMPEAGDNGIGLYLYIAVGAGLMILAILPVLFLLKRKTRPGRP